MSFMLLKECPFLASQTHTSVQWMSTAQNCEKPVKQNYPLGEEIIWSNTIYSFAIKFQLL